MRTESHLTRPRSTGTTRAEHSVYTNTGSEKKQLAFDLERARRETPGFRDSLHFNNAGASLSRNRSPKLLSPTCNSEEEVERLCAAVASPLESEVRRGRLR
jgi:hypothetical protein